jgi:hypothetical protein
MSATKAALASAFRRIDIGRAGSLDALKQLTRDVATTAAAADPIIQGVHFGISPALPACPRFRP